MATIGERNSVDGARRAWADLRDSSVEDLQDSPPVPTPLLHTDSYIETPEQSFDDFGGSAVNNMRGLMDSEELPAAPQSAATSLPVARRAAGASAWRPNLAAPEFVPTLSPVGSPATGAAGTPAAARAAEEAAREAAFPERSPSASSASRTRIRGKRRVQTATARPEPLSKRPRSNVDMEPQNSNATPAASSASGRCEEASSGRSPPRSAPDVGGTDEDWQRRHEKRLNVIQSIKTTLEYEAMATLRSQGALAGAAPTTPDANDRQISKRKWEAEVMHWRNDLRHYTRAPSAVATPARSSVSPEREVILPTMGSP